MAMTKLSNRKLVNARKAKKDEFYTQLSDIEKELAHYEDQFYDKIVYCNCDDPYESNFFKYFTLNFNKLGLKKLIVTNYHSTPKRVEINEVLEPIKDDVIELLRHNKNVSTFLHGDGDFRSEECIELLKQADIVVTNPPFSLFREYVAQLMRYEKKFLILGNQNAIICKEVFKYIKENKMWLGASIRSGTLEFRISNDYQLKTSNYRTDNEGNKYVSVNGVRWFTNLDYKTRYQNYLILHKKYIPEKYPRYDNYDAIEVSKTTDIPIDYDGVMGVPITFINKYNPEQFELLGIMNTGEENIGIRYKGTPHGRPLINGVEKYTRILIRAKKHSPY
jgi:hypothetical protein